MTYVPNYSARRFYWASQETISDFKPTDTNTAGSLDLATEGVLMCGAAISGTTLLWTTVDLWSAPYQGGDFVIGQKKIGTNCGIVSRNAFAVTDASAFWMGDGTFYRYNGFVSPLPCEVADYVFGNINKALYNIVFAYVNPTYGEITWQYASAAASEIDSYVTYNYIENHWTYGPLGRVAVVSRQAGLSQHPVMIDASGNIYDHETGNTRTGMSAFLESGPVKVGNGDKVVQAQALIPDDKTLGDVTATIFYTLEPDDAESNTGALTLASRTPIRVTGRQFRVRIAEAAATAWRVGTILLAGVLGGER